MRHFLIVSLLPLLLIAGCSRPESPVADKSKSATTPTVQVAPETDPKPVVNPSQPAGDPVKEPTVAPVVAEQEKYEAALSDGLVQMADQKWSEALLSFQLAQRYNDTEF